MELIYLKRDKVLHVIVKPDEYAALDQAYHPALFAKRNLLGCTLASKLSEQLHKYRAKDGPDVKVSMTIEG